MGQDDIAPLVHAAIHEHTERFRASDDSCYANISINGRMETCDLNSKKFKAWVARLVHQEHGELAGSSALNRAINLVHGELLEEPEAKAFIRTGHRRKSIFIDNVGEQRHTMKITSSGWGLIDKAPLLFRRPSGMFPLPLPDQQSDLHLLRDFLNVVSEEDYRLIIGWLITALIPSAWLDYGILGLTGPHGSAKSDMSEMLQLLTDPNHAGLRTIAHSVRSLNQVSWSYHAQVFDNVGALKNPISDALCRFCTGGSNVERSMRTDRDQTVLPIKSPVLTSSITSTSNRPDFLSREFLIKVPLLSKHTEDPLPRFKREAAPKIFAGILDALSTALANRWKVKLPDPGRLANFSYWCRAAETGGGLGWKPGSILDAYRRNQSSIRRESLELRPILPLILELLERGPWLKRTRQELYDKLTDMAGNRSRYPGFPRSPQELSAQLRELQDGLFREYRIVFHGLQEEKWRKVKGVSRRVIEMERIEE